MRRTTASARGAKHKARRLLRAAVVAAAGGTAAVLATTPAHALNWDWGPWYSGDGGAKAAVAYFEEHGDRLKLCDIDTDGLRAAVAVYDDNGLVYYFEDNYNDGDCSYIDYNDTSYSNLKENRWYTFRVTPEPHNGSWTGGRFYEIYNDH